MPASDKLATSVKIDKPIDKKSSRIQRYKIAHSRGFLGCCRIESAETLIN